MPITSSMIAADKIVVPTLPFSFPISFNVSTVIPTLVAVRITPTKTASRRIVESLKAEKPPKKGTATRNPNPIGTMTPPKAIKVADKPECFNSCVSVSKPAENKINTTPISAMASKN